MAAHPQQLLTDALPDLPREVIDRPKMGFTLHGKSDAHSIEAHVRGGTDVGEQEAFAKLRRPFDGLYARQPTRWSFSRVWSLVVLGHG